jgi:hypothetical protein
VAYNGTTYSINAPGLARRLVVGDESSSSSSSSTSTTRTSNGSAGRCKLQHNATTMTLSLSGGAGCASSVFIIGSGSDALRRALVQRSSSSSRALVSDPMQQYLSSRLSLGFGSELPAYPSVRWLLPSLFANVTGPRLRHFWPQSLAAVLVRRLGPNGAFIVALDDPIVQSLTAYNRYKASPSPSSSKPDARKPLPSFFALFQEQAASLRRCFLPLVGDVRPRWIPAAFEGAMQCFLKGIRFPRRFATTTKAAVTRIFVDSLHALHLRQWLAFLDPDRVRVMFAAEWRNSPSRVLQHVLRFLGTSDDAHSRRRRKRTTTTASASASISTAASVTEVLQPSEAARAAAQSV